MTSILIAALASGTTLVTLSSYFGRVTSGKTPKSAILMISLLLLAACIGVASLTVAPSPLMMFFSFIIALPSLTVAPAFSWVLSQRKTPIGDLKVAVGDRLLPFSATTSEGEGFSTEELAGRRTLIKFYRGGWCPYCSAELKAFDEMRGELAKYSVSVVALSKDTAEEAAMHKRRDGLHHTLLADPDLAVIRQYGVEHHKALGGTTNDRHFLGLPASFKMSFKSMAIPTTLLIDEHGTIRWIDQSEDYRVRSSTDRVLAAVRDSFLPRSGVA